VREPTIAWWPGRIPAGTSCDATMSEIDVMPTVVKLAGGEVPTEMKIDGMDVWPLLSGKSRESPHEALFYFAGNQLVAVRSGPWKLMIKSGSKGKGKKAANQPVEKAGGPELYNLDSDIGETSNVADKNPEVVKRLQDHIARMDEDLGVSRIGPGVRPCGKVANPKPLLKDAREYQ